MYMFYTLYENVRTFTKQRLLTFESLLYFISFNNVKLNENDRKKEKVYTQLVPNMNVMLQTGLYYKVVKKRGNKLPQVCVRRYVMLLGYDDQD